MFVIAFGDAFDGITLVGPFTDMESAFEYADRNRADSGDWHCVPVDSIPEESIS